MKQLRWSTAATLALGVAATAAACGSSDEKKKSPTGPTYMSDGGAGGEPGEAGTKSQSGSGGAPVSSGGKGSGGQPLPEAGAPSMGGVSGSAGAVAMAGAPEMAGAPSSAGAGGDGVGGCDTLVSDEHCGTCERNCTLGGTTCTSTGSAYYCKTVSLLDTGGQGFLGTLGTDSVFAAQTSGMPVGDYKIVRIPFTGGSSSVVWSANGFMGNGGVVVTATDVYWGVGGNPATVQTKPLSAKPADLPSVLFKPTVSPAWLLIRAGSFYWMTGGLGAKASIFTRALNGQPSDVGTEIMSVDQGQVSRLTSGTSGLYWTGRNGVPNYRLWYVPWAGGQPTEIPDSVVQDVSSLYARGQTLYFSSRNGSSSAVNGIYSFTTGDATVKQVAQSDSVYTLIADDDYVYYRTTQSFNVWRVPVAGGISEQIGVAALDIFAGQDATHLYTVGAWGSAGAALEVLK